MSAIQAVSSPRAGSSGTLEDSHDGWRAREASPGSRPSVGLDEPQEPEGQEKKASVVAAEGAE